MYEKSQSEPFVYSIIGCNEKFATESSLLNHIKSSHNGLDVCEETTKACNVSRHSQEMNEPNTFSVGESSLTAQLVTNDDSGNQYKTNDEIKSLITQTIETTYHCSECGKRFTHNSILN